PGPHRRRAGALPLGGRRRGARDQSIGSSAHPGRHRMGRHQRSRPRRRGPNRMSSETVVAIQPNELPEIRSELIEWLDSYIAHHLWDAASRRGAFEHLIGPPRPGDSRILRGTEIMRLEASELVYASAGVVELAKAAASSLPRFTLQREDVPMRGGLLVFETPPARIPNTGNVDVDAFDVAAVCWGPHPRWGDEAILVTVYMDRDKHGP